ncbi:pyridoxamine 5'-phosphate oxidase [Bartonella sp. DGB1]|uniref:pyridoxamine 5'-phosphate oxidase n=1 Tax=Bartonella sp. DGB1 TaxID=3239807 RepID=UPI0035247EC8
MSVSFTQIIQDFDKADCPFKLFKNWLELAKQTEPKDHNAFSLATVNQEGQPNVRILLLKEYNHEYFIFYTNFESTKGQELLTNKKAAMGFYWKSLERQIRIRGIIDVVSDAKADSYFASRPYLSKIGARVSQQSKILPSRQYFEDKLLKEQKKYPNDKVPRPDYWSGFCLKPLSIEFWQAEPSRLHDRIIFNREDTNSNLWQKHRLYP